jgi:hypothetical protein
MQKLFENFRIFLNEAGDPDSSDDNAPNPREVAKALERSTIENAIQDASFNSAQSSQHRWSPRQPIVDYNFDDRLGVWTYMASIPDGTNNADNWPTINSKKGEDLDAFLARVKQPHQLNLALKKNEKLFESWRKYLIEVDTDNDGIDDEKELAIIDKGEIEPEEQEASDEQKIFNAFLNNGAHGLQLAEMIGSPIAGDLKAVIQDVRNYIAIIEDPENEIRLAQVKARVDRVWLRPELLLAKSLDWHAHSVVSGVFNSAEKFFGGAAALKMADDFEEMVVEAGDYVWWHGKYKSPSLNIASKERSTALLSDLKEWAGV